MSTVAVRDALPEIQKTTKRVITRRGVMWLGQTCNLRCHFCYFLDRIDHEEHPEHAFMDLEKAKRICSIMVEHYGNNAIDIQGGEPTIWKDIYALVRHCRDIGLVPTLITNGLALSNKKVCTRLKEAGIRDLLVSVQGIGETYDQIVQTKRAYEKQERGIRNAIEAGIPLRFNCVLSKPVLPQLCDVARLAVESGARVVNFLAFNPFEDQQSGGKRSAFNVPRYSEVSLVLNQALDMLADAGIEANVRYVPLCMVEPRHRKSVYDFQQLPYDLHEWDYASWSWTGQQPQRMKWGDVSPLVDLREATFEQTHYSGPLKRVADGVKELVHFYPSLRAPAVKMHQTLSKLVHLRKPPPAGSAAQDELYQANGKMRASLHCKYKYGEACEGCAAREICDGFHGDYAELFGTGEARPIRDIAKITDPRHFIREQQKVVEAEDFGWAL
jgi:pyruvate-formate lyase-activating enzyme